MLEQGWDLKRLAMRKVNISGESGCVSLLKPSKHLASRGTSALRWLDLGSNDIRGRGATAIGRCPRDSWSEHHASRRFAETVCVRRGWTPPYRSCSIKTLRPMDLAHNGFGDRGAIAFAEALSNGFAPNLRVLLLGFNSIGPEGMRHWIRHCAYRRRALGRGMQHHRRRGHARDCGIDKFDALEEFESRVQQYRFTGRAFGSCSFGESFGETNDTLGNLKLARKRVAHRLRAGFGGCFIGRASLVQLNVGYNELYDNGAWEIAEALEDNQSLLGLDFQRNEITDTGASNLANTLSMNTIIQEIDLRSNMIGPDGIAKLQAYGTKTNTRWQLEPPKYKEKPKPRFSARKPRNKK